MRELELPLLVSEPDPSVYPLRVAAFEDEAAPTSRYLIAGFNAVSHPACKQPYARAELLFQHGDPNAVGRNGLTEEAVLAVLLDRVQARTKLSSSAATYGLAKHLRCAMEFLAAEPELLRV